MAEINEFHQYSPKSLPKIFHQLQLWQYSFPKEKSNNLSKKYPKRVFHEAVVWWVLSVRSLTSLDAL